MTRLSTVCAGVLFCAIALFPAGGATAQYWSVGISVGGGTAVAIHGGMHFGNTDDRRESGLTGGRTEIELVIGLPVYETTAGKRADRPSFGLNFRQTSEDIGLSAGVGFRFAPIPSGSAKGYRTVVHFPVGWEPYPFPARAFVYLGLGRRPGSSGENGRSSRWEFFVPWPKLQIYVKHTGGFHQT